MNKILLILFFALAPLMPLSASFLDSATIDDMPKHFSAYKVIDIPDIQVDYASSGFGHKLLIVKDNEFDEALLNNPTFKVVMELPTIPLTPIHGSYQAFLQSRLEIKEKQQGQATFVPTNEPRTRPHYMGTTSILNCVGVVLDQFQTLPHQGGFMHVDDKEFKSGRFGRLLDSINPLSRPLTKVTLTSCFYSPLLDNVLRTLESKGFALTQADITHAYTNSTLRIVPLRLTGMTMEQAFAPNSCRDFYESIASATDGPKMMLYDFESHRHHHMGFKTHNENNSGLRAHFSLITQREITTHRLPVKEPVRAPMERISANIHVGINIQEIIEIAPKLPQDQLMALCDVFNRLGCADLVAFLNKKK
jgi:hypothetical protein